LGDLLGGLGVVAMLMMVVGIFLVLHGLVHLLYAGQSLRYFQLRPDMTWPDGAWLFSRLFSDQTTRLLAAVMLALASIGFVIAGIALILQQDWWRPAVIGAAVFSSLIYILFWDGRFRALDAQGAVGLLINLANLAMVLIFKLT
jgi:hypothetical protein